MSQRHSNRPFSPLDDVRSSSLCQARPSEERLQLGAQRTTQLPRSPSNTQRTTLRTRMLPDEKRRVESLCVSLSESLRATVRPSNLLRALLILVRETESGIHAEARRVHGLERPSNNDRPGIEDFERALAVVIRDGISAAVSRHR